MAVCTSNKVGEGLPSSISRSAASFTYRRQDTLIFEPKFDIVNILKYFSEHPLHSFEKIALDQEVAKQLQAVLREYMSFHLDIGTLKSESIFNDNFRR